MNEDELRRSQAGRRQLVSNGRKLTSPGLPDLSITTLDTDDRRQLDPPSSPRLIGGGAVDRTHGPIV